MTSCVRVFDFDSKKKYVDKLNSEVETESFWERDDSQKILVEISKIQAEITKIESIGEKLQELNLMAELLATENDSDIMSEFISNAEMLKHHLEELQTYSLLNGEHDSADAILTVHAGAGGLDSQDWAEILYRMYTRWCEHKGYKIKIIDQLSDQEAGIKSVTLSVSGENAYGYLRCEQGVHRLVRISPFDSAKRRHTSFASVETLPILPNDVSINIRPEDLRVDTFRSSGAGGQHVNMTDSAIRITHIPTGIVVSCQTERSQHMNRATAMQVLNSKLYEKQRREREKELENITGEKMTVAWGSQIRSYTMHPFQLVKDHRTGYEVGNIQSVLDGNLDGFIVEYLKYEKKFKRGAPNNE